MLRFKEENMKKSFMLPLALSVTMGLCGGSRYNQFSRAVDTMRHDVNCVIRGSSFTGNIENIVRSCRKIKDIKKSDVESAFEYIVSENEDDGFCVSDRLQSDFYSAINAIFND